MAGPGRPRRWRASDPQRWVKENTVLKPVTPGSDDSTWPAFVLKEATIYHKDGRTLANPLMAHLEGPYIIRGVLEVDDSEHYSRLVSRGIKTAPIEVENCWKYSMGDGPVAFWVSGPCGWYEIRPSAKYQLIYNEILEAINLYYGILVAYEKHEKSRRKKKGKRADAPTLDQLFLEYAIRVGNGVIRDEVEALCHKWAEWLIAHFPKEAELDWSKTGFANWVKKSHPDLVKKVDDAAKGLIPPTPLPEYTSAPEPSRSVYDSSDVEMEDISMEQSRALPTRSLRAGKAKVETPVPIPEIYRLSESSVNPATGSASPTPAQGSGTELTSDDPMDHLFSAVSDIGQEMDIKSTTASRVTNAIFFKCKMKDYGGAKQIVSYFAKDILGRLGPDWNGTPWHKWLQENAVHPPTELLYTPEQMLSQLYRRTKSTRTPGPPKSTNVSEVPPAINLEKRARKPGLNSGAARGSVDDSVPGNHSQSLLRNRSSGKRATLRLTASKKRPAYFPEEDLEDTSSRGKKSSKRTHNHVSEDEPMDVSSEDDDSVTADAESSNEADPQANPVESQLPAPEGTSRVVLVAERLPTMSPTGHGGTWVCEREDCDHIVRDAEEPAGHASIQEHFAYHEAQAAKIDLARKESRGHLPIKNLLEKIQGIGEQALRRKRGTLSDSSKPLPAPIKRRLLL